MALELPACRYTMLSLHNDVSGLLLDCATHRLVYIKWDRFVELYAKLVVVNNLSVLPAQLCESVNVGQPQSLSDLMSAHS